MKIENQHIKDMHMDIDDLLQELMCARKTCHNHIKGQSEYLCYNDDCGYEHAYKIYECKFCGESMGEEKVL